MRRMMMIAGAMLGVLLVVALSAATASAETDLPILLNSLAELVTAEKFETGNVATVTKLTVLKENSSVECKKLESTAELKELELLIGTDKVFGFLGPFHINFKECSAIFGGVNAGTCTGLGVTTSGQIEVLGEAHLVYDALGTGEALGAAVLFLLPSVGIHFECKSIVTILALVLGSVLCLIKPINVVTSTFELKCEVGEPGDQKELKYSSGKLPLALDSTAGLFTSKNEGEEVDSAQQGTVTVKSALLVKIDA